MRGWKRLSLVLVFAFVCIGSGSTGAWAEEHGTRVAIVEMMRILDESSAIRSIRTQGEARRRAYAADMQQEAARLEAIRAELLRQETLLAPAVLEERTRAFNAEVAAADQRALARGRLLERALEEGESRFRDALDTVVADVARRQGFDVVLPVHESLFAVAAFNVTDPVIERLNEAFPEIVLTFDDG